MTPRRLSLPACARHPVESSLAGWLLILWSVRQIAEQEAFGKAIGMDLFNFMESFNHGVVSNGLPAGCGILSRSAAPPPSCPSVCTPPSYSVAATRASRLCCGRQVVCSSHDSPPAHECACARAGHGDLREMV